MKRTACKKKNNQEKQQNRLNMISTENGRMIYNLMLSRKIKGRYKDYVIINASRMIDWLGSYEIMDTRNGTLESFTINGVALIHKRNLYKILGKEVADKFWKCGKRTNYGVESRRLNCVVKNEKTV